jgi:class 3 adenylate cyclase/tetratricopeptide (TPR) repeat protein
VLTCSHCGQGNPDGFRFCGACGAKLSSAAPRQTRKTVTIVFADLVGSTQLGERLDPEAMRNVTQLYFDEMQAAIEHHGGTVEKFIGDAVMAVFGIPRLHEDDALRALRAATEMHERLAAANDELERRFGVRLQVRIGVNSGEVVTGDHSTGQRLATGDAVNVAARLQTAAEPGEVLVGQETTRLARAGIEIEPRGALKLKGKATCVDAYRLVRVSSAAGPAIERHLDLPIVGRGDELRRVRAAFEAACRERRCRLFTVFGPAGIGKSRLAREISTALASDARVLSGHCRPYGEGITYEPLREIFAAAGMETTLDEAVTLGSTEDTFRSVHAALEQRAREQPHVLVIEDIHWAQPTLLDLLEHLVERIHDAPLLLLCMSRPVLLDVRPGWGNGRVNSESLTLQPLPEEEAAELLETRTQSLRLDSTARAKVLAAAEGHPLYIEQILAGVAEGGDPEHIPPTIHALLAARVDVLNDDERDVIERAAVAGLEFERDLIAYLADAAPTDATFAGLIRKQLIGPQDAEGAFEFRHALIRDAAYERIPKALRADLHERAARWFASTGGQHEALIGFHLEQAVRLRRELGLEDDRTSALAEEAGSYLGEAGRRAHATFDIPAAVNLIERSLQLLPQGPARVELMLRLAWTVKLRGDLQRSHELKEEAVASVAASKSVPLHWRVRLEVAAGRPGDPSARLTLGEEAVAALDEEGDQEALLHALSFVSWAGLEAAQGARAADAADRALALARRLGEWVFEAELTANFCNAVVWGPTPVPEAIERIESQVAAGRQNPSVAAPGNLFLGVIHALDGRLDEGLRRVDMGLAMAEELGAAWPAAWARGALRARIGLMWSSDPEAAERDVRMALEAHEAMGERGTVPEFRLRLAQALWMQGREEDGVAVALDLPRPEHGPVDVRARWCYVRAQALARNHQLDDAETLAREAIALLDPSDYLWDRAEAWMALADVLRRSGRPRDADAAVHEALRLYERKGHVVGVRRATAELAAAY